MYRLPDIDSLQYAIALQSRYDEEDLFLAEELSRLVQEAECTFTCDACRLQHPEDRTLSLRPCGHSFCPGCLRAHVICELDDRRFPVHCPACIGLHTNAEHGVVTNATVLELGISDEHYDVWVELEMSPISAVLHCRKCGNSSFVDRRDVEEMPTLQCPLPGCSNAWCKLCQTTIIVGGPRHTCNEPVDAVDHFADLKLLRDRMHQERDHKQLAYQLTHGTLSTLSDLQRATNELSNDAANITVKTEGFAVTIPTFKDALSRTIKVPADNAIASVVRLGDAALQLSVNRITLATTRALAQRAQREFKFVHERAQEALQLASDLNIEVVYWRTRAEVCIRGLQDCKTLAAQLARGAEQQVALSRQRISAAVADCERAAQTHSSAQDRRRRYKRAATIRNIFTLGIGALFDIGGLSAAVEAAEKVMRTASRNREEAAWHQEDAQSALNARQDELRAIDGVATRLDALLPACELAQRTLDECRARLADGVTTAFDVSVFFGGLSSRTAAWDVITSAPALAEAVVKLQRLLDPDTRLTGAFITSPEVLNEPLKRLAESNVPMDELSALM